MTRPDRDQYRPCVGTMLINAAGEAFVGKRIDNKEGDWWQMPQGGVDDGEDLDTAMLRELGEETGIGPQHLEIVHRMEGELFYELPPELLGKLWGGRYKGQRQNWYLVRFTGAESRHRPRRAQAPGILRVQMGRSRTAAPPDRAVQAASL